jgi:hypothetical protein
VPHVELADRGHRHFGPWPLPIGGLGLAVLIAVLATVILLLLLVQDAKGSFV